MVKKAFLDPRTETIQIDAEYCYRIDLKTSKSEEIQVVASMEGEYADDLLISIEESGATAMVSADFQPLFVNPNDKLSAHKVVSIALEIQVPEYKSVQIFGTNSNVYAQGAYQKLSITLADGMCALENVTESVEVTTQKGDITLLAPSGTIDAESNYGQVESNVIPYGNNQFILRTVQGDIYLKKTK
ncbi:hypothetical protein [Flagellimonas sp. GZD32]|uniref:hypothetical protein n=1 Tax=Flagellimonas cixiensis TaxID=3228750 RepID=UPI0035C8DEA9